KARRAYAVAMDKKRAAPVRVVTNLLQYADNRTLIAVRGIPTNDLPFTAWYWANTCVGFHCWVILAWRVTTIAKTLKYAVAEKLAAFLLVEPHLEKSIFWAIFSPCQNLLT